MRIGVVEIARFYGWVIKVALLNGGSCNCNACATKWIITLFVFINRTELSSQCFSLMPDNSKELSF